MRVTERDEGSWALSGSTTSIDDLLKELCMIRCSSCEASTILREDKSQDEDDLLEQLSVTRSFVRKRGTTGPVFTRAARDTFSPSSSFHWNKVNSLFTKLVEHSNSAVSVKHNRSLPLATNTKRSVVSSNPYRSSTCTPRHSHRGKRNVKHTSVREIRQARTAVKYLLKGRCTSPDCRCEKQEAADITETRHTSSRTKQFRNKRSRKEKLSPSPSDWWGLPLKSIASQTTETSLAQKLGGSDRNILTEEINRERSLLRDLRLIKYKGFLRDGYQYLGNTVVSSDNSLENNLSDSIFSCIGQNSDSQLFPSGWEKEDIKCTTPDRRKNKNHLVDTYGKLLHKMDKFKKMSLWKSKRCKRKMKYSLDGKEDQVANDSSKYPSVEKVNMDEVMAAPKEKLQTGGGDCLVDDVNKTSEIRRWRDAAVQPSRSFLSIRSRSPLSLLTCKENMSGEFDVTEKSHETLSQVSRSSRHLGKDGSFTCCRGSETDQEILSHLQQINRLIRGKSLDRSSNHRLSEVDEIRSAGKQSECCSSSNQQKEFCSKEGVKKKKELLKNGSKTKTYWAVTKVTVHPDSSRTYEVMKLSRRKPDNIPSTSETVFVLLPNK